MIFSKAKGMAAAAGIAFALALAGSPARATERAGDQGIGVMLGNPSGFSYKMWLSDVVALDGAVGIDRSDFDVHATFLFHNFTLAHQIGGLEGVLANGDLPFYFGVGPRILFEKKDEFGVRIPLGVSFLPRSAPWDIFFEVAPVLRLTPSTGINGDFAIGARYYFPAVRPRG